eukprot:TRINITY_DN15373_c0_g1_i1.p1 TRINITY_DN15373_c0_g1~~TRINITY_DN15373_c0_g1_i1.p1  ORF type:complete len:405 (+),score=102.14 TRINITY_DN15373_c0_g1_i1:44-1258(+)
MPPNVNGIPQLLHQQSAGLIKPDYTRQQFTSWAASKLSLSKLRDVDTNCHSAGVTCLDIDQDEGRYILNGCGDGTIYIHDIQSNPSELALHIGRSNKHSHRHSVGTVGWGSDTGLFITSSRDGILKVWDTNCGRPAEQFTIGGVINKHAAANPEVGTIVAVAGETNHVTLIDLKSGSTSHVLRGHAAEVVTLAWSLGQPNILATGGGDNKVILWDVRQARSYLQYLDYNNVRFKRSKDITLAGSSHQNPVHGLVFSGCGRYLISLGKDKRIRKWDTMTGKNLKTKFAEVNTSCKNAVDIVCSSRGARDFLFVPEKSFILMIDLQTGKTVRPLVGHYGSVAAMAYSPANMELYSGAKDKNILIWEPETTKVKAWLDHKNKVEDESDETQTGVSHITRDTWSSDED